MIILVTGGSGFIGTNLIDELLQHHYEVVNFDKAPPLKKAHSKYWVQGDIMNLAGMQAVFEKYKPTVVIHLAARTDTLSDKIEDYKENSLGTLNVLNVIKTIPSIERSIITSTQYVYKSLTKPFPDADDEYMPHTIYGHSKVKTEQYTRESNIQGVWTIIRPANIWGPWHMRYPKELWRMIDKGFYMHPGKKPVIRTYGYVKNIVHQIIGIMVAAPEQVNKRTFCVGDNPIDSYIWLNTISNQLKGKNVNHLPISFFKLLSFSGDILRKVGIPFPLYAERFHNMIEDYYAPTNITVSQFGVANPNLEENVAETISWIKGEGNVFFEYWKAK
ncbi:NAD-dependent epimerase/dehydratase family protein [Parasediminibacterium sp. JCM 36343]|uniref:NAD-dependent epimerase/dehydratase family protein n=1 Tax=Parasediminibacterium sp. JCM 36343 TaxID=3374279 RepID=UPI00397A461E